MFGYIQSEFSLFHEPGALAAQAALATNKKERQFWLKLAEEHAMLVIKTRQGTALIWKKERYPMRWFVFSMETCCCFQAGGSAHPEFEDPDFWWAGQGHQKTKERRKKMALLLRALTTQTQSPSEMITAIIDADDFIRSILDS